MPDPDDTVVRIRTNDLTWREVEGEIIALDLLTSTYFTTNRTGTVLWHALVDGATVPQLVQRLVESFGITEDVASADTDAFLKLVRGNGLLDRQG